MQRAWDTELLANGDSRKVLILLALADWSNDEGYCWPSMALIASRARCSEATARRLLQQLERRGLIRIELNRGRGHTNRYWLTIGIKEVQVGLVDPDVKPCNMSEVLVPENGDRKPCNPSGENLAIRDEKVSKPAENLAQLCYPEPIEPSKNRKKNHQGVSLPDWLPPEVWDHFRSHRHTVKNKHGPWTDRVEAIALKKLTELREQGFDPVEVIEQTILNGWAGLFPVRNGSGNGTAQISGKTVSKAEQRDQRIRESSRKVAEYFGIHGDAGAPGDERSREGILDENLE